MNATLTATPPCMTKAEKRAWDAGFAAFDANMPTTSNPYRPHKPAADLRLALTWLKGYEAASATAEAAR